MSFKELLCKFFQNGSCAYGDGCLYSHDPNSSVPIPNDVCLFYLRSDCKNGDQCFMKHQTIYEIVQQYYDNNVNNNGNIVYNNENTTNNQASESNTDNVALGLTSLSINDDKTNLPSTSKEVKTDIPCSSQNKSYASAAQSACDEETDTTRASLPLCSYFQSNGFCVYPNCRSIHGNLCDLCGFYSLHPYNKQLSDNHRMECVKIHEESMEISFAYARSKDLTCGICLDIVVDKEPRAHRRFGILENCSHVYCIECIRKWRNARDVDTRNRRNCPQCRKKSDFIIPSQYFYENQEDKQKMIDDYKKALKTKHCKYFKRGQGECPFEGSCFYKHQYPDGKLAKSPKPSKSRNRILRPRLDLGSYILFDDEILTELQHRLSASDIDYLYGDEISDDDYDIGGFAVELGGWEY